MLKGTKLVEKLRSEVAAREHPNTIGGGVDSCHSGSDNLEWERFEQDFRSNGLIFSNSRDYGQRIPEYGNCFFKRRFLSGVSSCSKISFIRRGGDSFAPDEESMKDLMNMLKFKSEPCYQRPYRLIADSKLCLKGSCDDVSMILRPGW